MAHQNLEKSFEEFFRQESSINLQRRMLGPIPASLLGWICTTDNLMDSLDSLCEFVRARLSLRHDNRTSSTRAVCIDDLSEDTKSEICRLNKWDLKLYSEARRLNTERNQFSKIYPASLWVNHHVAVNDAKILGGCAFRRGQHEPVQLELLLDDQVIGECGASEEFNEFARFSFPRKRYIGFRIPINNISEGKLSLRVADTHQVLFTQLVG